MRTCSFCKIEKPLTDYYKSSRTKDGVQTYCIDCSKKRRSGAAERKRDREYHQQNKEHRNAYYRRYRKENSDKIRESRREYLKAYRKANSERINAYLKVYYAQTDIKIARKIKKALRREAEKSRADGTLTVANLRALAEFQGHQCKTCPATLFQEPGDTHLDHIVPISAGGKHSVFNTQWLCSTCNLQKGATVYALYPQQFTAQFNHML